MSNITCLAKVSNVEVVSVPKRYFICPNYIAKIINEISYNIGFMINLVDDIM